MSIYKELSYDQDIEIVKGLQFSVMSPEEIVRRSVVEITKTDTYNGHEPVIGGLFDPRMGVLEHNRVCATCEQKNIFCPGHFGHIKLARPVYHALFFETMRKVMRCVCYRCSRLLVSPAEANDDHRQEITKAMNTKNLQKRWDTMSKLCFKMRKCGDDGSPNGCGAKQPTRYVRENNMKIVAEWKDGTEVTRQDMTPEDALRIFRRMTEADMEAIGFNPQWNRPEWMVVQVLPVPPPAVRPSIIEESGQRREDDLTHKLCDILKTNQQLQQRIDRGNASEEHLSVMTGALQYHCATFLDNQIPGLPPSLQRNGRKLKSISDRLKKKEGRIRGNLNGKRVDQSARSVITPDPIISLDELGVPVKVAMNLTFPEKVNRYNLDHMRALVRRGPEQWPGAKYVRKVSDGRTYTLKIADREKVATDLAEGDTVDRHLGDGDYVLFNRQPSLHRMSMMCHRARVMPFQTFRLNPTVCQPFNADFDGDEMNLMMPQSVQTMSELMDFASVPYHVISPKDGKPVIEVIQDSMSGSFLLTKAHVRIPDKTFANLQMVNSYFDGRLPKAGLDGAHYTGFQASTQILPPNFFVDLKNKKGERVLIRDSVHVSGTIDKNVFHSQSKGIVPVIFHDYSPFEVRRYLDNVQRMICRWLMTYGFSVGISDLVVDPSIQATIHDLVSQMKGKVDKQLEDVRLGRLENNSIQTNSDFVETLLMNSLNETMSKIEKEGLHTLNDVTNRMINMVRSGAKGKDTNVAQMVASVGQQNVEGKRVAYGFSQRTLPHYCKYDDGPEARGYVENSFLSGLSPQEMFFHAMGGREGLIDTAVKSVTGDTPIVILEDGKPKYVKIGEWIDARLAREAEKIRHFPEEANMELLDLDNEIYIPTGDEDGNVTWGAVTAMTRHDPSANLYRVKTVGGRSVIVAESKSLLIWQPETGKFKETNSPDVKVGDCMPVTANLPEPPVIIDYVDMSTYFPKTEYVHGTEFHKAAACVKEAQGDKFHIPRGWWEANNGTTFVTPYRQKAQLKRATVRSNVDNIEDGFIYPYHARREGRMPERFELNHENGVFIGIYLADGCCHELSGKVSITKEDLGVREWVGRWFDKHHITHKMMVEQKLRGITTSIEGNSTLMARFLDAFVGHLAGHKHIPDVAYVAPLEFVRGVLAGYFSGDGSISRGGVVSSSTSQRLSEGIAMLCNRVGIFAKISHGTYTKENNLGIIPSDDYRLSIRAQWGEHFANTIDLIMESKKEALRQTTFCDNHRNYPVRNDMVLDKIVSIQVLDNKEYPKLYDLTIPSTLNFVLANGLNCRDTSETGYIQRRLVKAMEDAKIYYDYTVRNATGQIVQFLYGEDGMDGTQIESQTVPTLLMNVLELEQKYLLRADDLLSLHIQPETLAKMRDESENDWAQAARKHFEEILADRQYALTTIFARQKPDKILYPIAFERLIHTASQRLAVSGLHQVPTDLTPKHVLSTIDILVKELKVTQPNQGTRFMGTLLRAYLSPKPLIFEHRMHREAFDWIVAQIRAKFREAVAQPGEMVGVIAAQSIGESNTQLSCAKNTNIRTMSVRATNSIKKSSFSGEIGDFIDALLAANPDKVVHLGNDSVAMNLDEGIDDFNIIGVDSITEKTSWRRISQISRHPANGGMVRVTTQAGRTTTATLSHSFLKRTKNGIVPVRGEELRIGHRIPVARSIPIMEVTPNTVQVGDRTFTLNRDFGWFLGAYMADGDVASCVSISKVIPIFEERLRAFCTEHGYELKIRLSTGSFEGRDEVYESKRMTIGGQGCTYLGTWVKNEFGTGSYVKRIPAWVYGCSQEFIAGMLNGYFDGDGNVFAKRDAIRTHSVNEGMTDDFLILLAQCGIFASKLRERRKREKANLFHVIQISRKYAERFLDVVGLYVPEKLAQLNTIVASNRRIRGDGTQRDHIDVIPELYEDIAYIGRRLEFPGQSRHFGVLERHQSAVGRQAILRFVDLFETTNALKGPYPDVTERIERLKVAAAGDVVWDKIVKLEILPDPETYVYDFTVPGNDSFMVDAAVLVHNTLDSFHVSGTAAAVKATSGVPRLKELLSVSKNIKTPSMTIYLKPDVGTVERPDGPKDPRLAEAKERAFNVLRQLEITRLSDVVDATEIFWDPPGATGLETGIPEDGGMMAAYRAFQSVRPTRCRSTSPWVLRLMLNKAKLHHVRLTMIDIYTRIHLAYHQTIDCAFADDNEQAISLHVRLTEQGLKDIEADDIVAALKAVEHNVLHSVLLKGIHKINRVSMDKKVIDRYNPVVDSYDSANEWVLTTDGTNFQDILTNPNVDSYRTMTNDIWEIFRTLGIEAARAVLYYELNQIIDESGISYRHMSMLLDTVTSRGSLMSIDRHGINRGDVGPLAKSSFEETTDMLIKASIFSDVDRINGVSANIMLGQIPPCGTGDSEILLDEDRYLAMLAGVTNTKPGHEAAFPETEPDVCEVPTFTTRKNKQTLPKWMMDALA